MTSVGKQNFFDRGKERFLKEARTLAKFSYNEGIANVRDFFEANNTAYLVMEYIDGITLSQYIKRSGRLSADKTVELMMPVMNALKNVHSQNVIHRDISPNNIMITNDGKVKLLDFGAARGMSSDTNRSMSVMLCPGYAPEEQYRSRGIQGAWTDIYALCAVMYKCITGITPIEANERVIEDTLKPPSAYGIDIPLHIENALMKGMSVLQKERFANISELLNALAAQQNAQPVQHTESAACADAVREADKIGAEVTPADNVYTSYSSDENRTTMSDRYADEPKKPAKQPKPQKPTRQGSGETVIKAKPVNKKRLMIISSAILAVVAAAVIGLVIHFANAKITVGSQSVSLYTRELNLENVTLTNSDISKISMLKHLRSLSIKNADLSYISTDISLDGCEKISSLSFEKCGGKIDLVYYALPNKAALKKLKVRSCGDFWGANFTIDFKELTGLKELELSAVNSQVKNYEMAGGVESFISSDTVWYDTAMFSGFTGLKKLQLVRCTVKNINFVRDMPQLTEVDFTNTPISDRSPLDSCPKLKTRIGV